MHQSTFERSAHQRTSSTLHMRVHAALLLVVAVILLQAAPSDAWGPAGHRIVGRIASYFSTTQTSIAVAKMLGNHTWWDLTPQWVRTIACLCVCVCALVSLPVFSRMAPSRTPIPIATSLRVSGAMTCTFRKPTAIRTLFSSETAGTSAARPFRTVAIVKAMRCSPTAALRQPLRSTGTNSGSRLQQSKQTTPLAPITRMIR